MGGYVKMTMTIYLSKIEMSRALLRELDILCRKRKKEVDRKMGKRIQCHPVVKC